MLPELYEVFFPEEARSGRRVDWEREGDGPAGHSPTTGGQAATTPVAGPATPWSPEGPGPGLTPAQMQRGLRRLGHDLKLEEVEALARSLGWAGGPLDTLPWRDFAVAVLGWSAPSRHVFMKGLFDGMDTDRTGIITKGPRLGGWCWRGGVSEGRFGRRAREGRVW